MKKNKIAKAIATILSLIVTVFGLKLVLQSLNKREELLDEEDNDFDEEVT